MLRSIYGISRRVLADKIDMSRGTIERLEAGHFVKLDTLSKVAEVFHVTVQDLRSTTLEHFAEKCLKRNIECKLEGDDDHGNATTSSEY